MSQQLTEIMSRAVPEVEVKSAVIASPWSTRFFIYVEPNHSDYWLWFKRGHPRWRRIALKYEVVTTDAACPEFGSYENLVSWLLDVLNLSQGERNLLRFCVRF
ncbi:hypothetical protein DRO59_06110 [Candidatus Bathyarchaeota archaeon]|nr:MAG: hypothetical protein DRO59_06110 [Candidatus Bathyarchaeota archaeon]